MMMMVITKMTTKMKIMTITKIKMIALVITGSQPRVDSAAWFASAIGPNFNPRECTPEIYFLIICFFEL